MPQAPIILFDGVCNLCNAAINWIIDRDSNDIFRFASLQSEAARQLLPGIDSLPDSIVLIDEAGVHTRSTAAIRIARRLGFPWSLAIFATPLPAFFRDAAYKWIARNRYSWFGRTSTCRIPTPDLASRFLDQGERIEVPPSTTQVEPSNSFWVKLAYVYAFIYIFPFPLEDVIPGYAELWHKIIPWLASQILGLDATTFPAGSGDTTYNYVETLFDATLAILATLCWRKPIPQWFPDFARTGLRYYLATYMTSYGWAKLVPLQFDFPGPAHLLRSFGDASPMGLLWTMMGASPAYQMFTGFFEVLAGTLLFFRRTALSGAFLSAIVMIQIVALNFSYDIPVKLFSSHLLAFSLLLLSPDLPGLFSFIVLQLPAAPAIVKPFYLPLRWMPPLRLLFKSFVVINALIVQGYYNYHGWKDQKASILNSPFHGFYAIESFESNATSPRWIRAGITGSRSIAILKSDGTYSRFRLTLDAKTNSWILQASGQPLKSTLHYSNPAPDSLLLEGNLEGVPVKVLLKKLPPTASLLTSRGFHWINELPFNK